MRSRSGIVLATRDWHPASTVHFASWPVHCVAGSRGAEYGPIDREALDVEIFKGFLDRDDGYSGFEGVTLLEGDAETGFRVPEGAKTLAQVLEASRIRTVRIVGLATDYCVKATALDAAKLRDAGLLDRVTVVRSGIAAVNLRPGDGERALAEMSAAGIEIA